jgi:predicted kinase
MDLSRIQALDVVLVAGLPASGKSTFARTHFAKTGHRRVNRKEIRRFLYSMSHFGEPWRETDFNESDEALVKHVERKIVEHFLHAGARILLDNTSVTVASRADYLQLARQTKKRAGIVFLNTPVLRCIEQNRKRDDPVPESVISNLFASIQMPARAEGFDEVLVVS